ncbi:unnamed protein product [Protopolystoma xenopodis]|uniref:Uncharacterized protein n=1 Tax=Protopolystoma xenopodis TaxID=117903 RepID=A0A3S5B4M4_9PLAT|nr:unnamed protein product [Protopolystoma xenopodis]
MLVLLNSCDIDILGEKNVMNRRLEEGRVSDNFAYCLSKLGGNKKRDFGHTRGPNILGFISSKTSLHNSALFPSRNPPSVYGALQTSPGTDGGDDYALLNSIVATLS